MHTQIVEQRNGPRMLTFGLTAGILTWASIFGLVALGRKLTG